MKKIFNLSFLIVATIIGAGFSSGKEIMIFFNNTGKALVFNIISASILFFISLFCVLMVSQKYKLNNYLDFAIFITNGKIGKILDFFINIFILIIFWIMFSAFGTYLQQVFNIPSVIGAILLAIICHITFKFNINGLINVSKYIVPLIILGILLIFIMSVQMYNGLNVYLNLKNNYLSGTIYASYNIVIAVPILISICTMIKDKKEIFCISGITTFILISLIFVICKLNTVNVDNLISIEMPLLYIAKMQNVLVYFYYIVIVCLAIYTTAISCGYTVLLKQRKKAEKYDKYSKSICIVGICFSFINFSKLMDYGFNIIGWFGIIQLILTIFAIRKKDLKG